MHENQRRFGRVISSVSVGVGMCEQVAPVTFSKQEDPVDGIKAGNAGKLHRIAHL